MRHYRSLRIGVVAAITLLLSAQLSFTQRVTTVRGSTSLTEGLRYMVAFPQVWSSASEAPMPIAMMLTISSREDATVRISTPARINDAGGIDRTIKVASNTAKRIAISTAYMNVNSERRTGYGILLTSDKPISVSTSQMWNGNGEVARHLPVDAWGRSYYTMNFYQDRFGTPSPGYEYRPSQIVIIADRDNTVVSYTPTVDTEGGIDVPSVKKGTTATVTLERGECFMIKAKINESLHQKWESDLSGTWIRSTKPIGVVSGHTKVGVLRYPEVISAGALSSPGHFLRNNIHDALIPVEMAGTKFVTIPLAYTPTRIRGKATPSFGVEDDRGDVIRVIALEDNTTVKSMLPNGLELKTELTLRKGETAVLPTVETATYWESDKPILVGQYGKSYAKDPAIGRLPSKPDDVAMGHPTVPAGMPSFQCVPSIDRWVTYGVFDTPEGMDTFMNIVFRTADVSKIKFNGRPLTSALGGAIRMLRGTAYGYIATPVAQGTAHVVESIDSTVRWMAWTYGSLDGLVQGRAYSTPVAVDVNVPCDDSITVTETTLCGSVQSDVTIVGGTANCGSIYHVYASDLVNYTFEQDQSFVGGDPSTRYTLSVVDSTASARAVVRIMSRSGRYVEKTYVYTPDKVSLVPGYVNFETIPWNTPVKKTITITNASPGEPVAIKRLRVNTHNDVFACTPNADIVLPPNGSKVFEISATVQSGNRVIDSIVVEYECRTEILGEVVVQGEQPSIFVSDVAWGTIEANSPGVDKKVRILNAGRADLIVTGYDQQAIDTTDNFFNLRTMSNSPLASAFPITIPGNASFDFSVTYSPNGVINVPHRVSLAFYSNAPGEDSIAVLTGVGGPFTGVEDAEDGRANDAEARERIVCINPLPAREGADVDVRVHGAGMLEVLTLEGRRVYSHAVGNGTSRLRLDLASFAPGLYTVVLSGSSGSTSHPLLVIP